MRTLVEELLAAIPVSDVGEVKHVNRYGHRSLCGCMGRWRGRILVTRRRCTCREFLENHRLYLEERARVAALPSLHEQGVMAERERLRPLLDPLLDSAEDAAQTVRRRADAYTFDDLGLRELKEALAALRTELGKETS